MAILAAAAYPMTDAALLARLSNECEKLTLTPEERAQLFLGVVVSGLQFDFWFEQSKGIAERIDF